MGGGGGGSGWSSWSSKTDIHKILKETESEAKRSEYNTSVNEYLQSMLTDFNDRRTEEIQDHLATIKSALDKEIEGSVDLVFGGSISKHTYVNGLSDVDMLVRINDTSLENASPAEVKTYFAQRLRERLPSTEITVGQLAVTVKFTGTGHEIQLLPAITTKKGLRIADKEGEKWSPVIKPNRFAEKLTRVNNESGGKVVPVIKLFKGLNAALPETSQLSGYHIESLAIEAFESYSGRKTYKDMLQHLCREASKMVLSPITDSTGQSVHVDEYLGSNQSHARKVRSATLERLSNKLGRADAHLASDRWGDVFSG